MILARKHVAMMQLNPGAIKLDQVMNKLNYYMHERGLTECKLLILDLGWCGGLTEARRCAALAGAYQTPVAAHDCNGPVVLTASVHFCQSTKNAYVQEIVRAFYYGWYDEIVTQLPPIKEGKITVPEGPGLGLELQDDFKKRKSTISRKSNKIG